MFNKLKPLLAGSGAENDPSLREDYKKSVRVEKFRIGEKAVYIPAGFSWKYLLKKDIDKITKAKWVIQSDNCCAPWSTEAPALRLWHRDGEEILELEKEKSAEKALNLLGLRPHDSAAGN